MTALAIIHKQEIIEQVEQGMFLDDIARQLGITPAAISKQLKDDDDYIAAREAGVEARLEQQYRAITEAQSMTTISRGREGFRAASWFAEREFPQRWGRDTRSSQTDTNLNTISTLLLTQAIKSLPKPQGIDNTIDMADIRTTDVMLNDE